MRASAEHAQIEMTRDRADRWIGVRAGRPPSDEILLARIDELLRPNTRRALARAYRRIAPTRPAEAANTPAQLNRRRLRRMRMTSSGSPTGSTTCPYRWHRGESRSPTGS